MTCDEITAEEARSTNRSEWSFSGLRPFDVGLIADFSATCPPLALPFDRLAFQWDRQVGMARVGTRREMLSRVP